MSQVFISYRQTDEAQKLCVRAFGERLRGRGIEVILDQFYVDTHPGGPNEGWDKWSSDHALSARRVLIIGTPAWYECFEKKQPPGTGLGAACEADDLRHRIYKANGIVEDIRIVVFDQDDAKGVPAKFERYHCFHAVRDFDNIARWVKGAVTAASPKGKTVQSFPKRKKRIVIDAGKKKADGLEASRSWKHAMWTRSPFIIVLAVVLVAVWGFLSIRDNSKRQAEIAEQRSLDTQNKIKDTIEEFSRRNRGETENVNVLARATSYNPIENGPRNSDAMTRANARLVLKYGDRRQQAIGYLILEDYPKADEIIQRHLDAAVEPSREHQFWLTMQARSQMQQAFVSQAYDTYRKTVNKYPEDWRLRIEWVNAMLSPILYGIRLPSGGSIAHVGEGRVDGMATPTGGMSELMNRLGGMPPENLVPLAENQLQWLLSLGNPPPELLQARPFLCYRLGECSNLLLRIRRTPQRRIEAIKLFEEASRLFREQGEMMIAAESLHKAAVANFLAANLLEHDGGRQYELRTYLDNALEHLDRAETILGGREQLLKSVPGYFVAKRKAHALIRHPFGQPQRLGEAKIFLSLAEQSPGFRHDKHALIHLEIWLYQRLADHENRKENLTLAVKSWKRLNNGYYYNQKGEECRRDDAGREVVTLTEPEKIKVIAMSLAPMDFAEPAICFTFFKDWIKYGGDYGEYSRFPVN